MASSGVRSGHPTSRRNSAQQQQSESSLNRRRVSLMATDRERLGELPLVVSGGTGGPYAGWDSRRSSLGTQKRRMSRENTADMHRRSTIRRQSIDPNRINEVPDRRTSFMAATGRKMSVRSLITQMEQATAGSASGLHDGRRLSLADEYAPTRGRRASLAISSALSSDRFNCVADLFCGRIGYADAGDPNGFPVFIFSGLGGHRYDALLLDSSARRHGLRIIYPDRPGMGLSEPLPEALPLSEWISHSSYIFRGLCRQLGISQAALVGHSLGCTFALGTASDPESAPLLRGTTICLLSPWGLPGSPSPTHQCLLGLQNLDLERDRTPLRQLLVGRTRAKGLSLSSAEAAILDSEQAEQIRSSISSTGEPLGRDLAPLLGTYGEDLASAIFLSEISEKVLICHGEFDPVVPVANAEWLEAALPRSQLAIRQGGTHCLLFDKQVVERLFTLIHDDLKAVYTRSPSFVAEEAEAEVKGESDPYVSPFIISKAALPLARMPEPGDALPVEPIDAGLDAEFKRVLIHSLGATLIGLALCMTMDMNVGVVRRLMYF